MNHTVILGCLTCINLGFLGGWFVLKALVLKEINRKKNGQSPETLRTLNNIYETVHSNFPG